MKKFSLFQSKDQKASVLFALFSQSIWLPVFMAGYDEQNFARLSPGASSMSRASYLAKNVYSLPSSPLSSSSLGYEPSRGKFRKEQDTGLVLHSTLASQQVRPTSLSRSLVSRTQLGISGKPVSFAVTQQPLLSRFLLANRDNTTPSVTPNWLAKKDPSPIQRLYTRSELLGGTLTLDNLNEPLMPAIARAERAQWLRSGDPLAPLPELWREPMRRALVTLLNSNNAGKQGSVRKDPSVISIESARFVHVPSSRIRRSSEIPLALQPDGSVDILNKPDDPAIIEEINRWSERQRLPQKGRVTAAVVHLHPFISESSVKSAPGTSSPQPQIQPRPSELASPKPSGSVSQEVSPAPSSPPLTQTPSTPALAPEPTPSPVPAISESTLSPQPVSDGHSSASTEGES